MKDIRVKFVGISYFFQYCLHMLRPEKNSLDKSKVESEIEDDG